MIGYYNKFSYLCAKIDIKVWKRYLESIGYFYPRST